MGIPNFRSRYNPPPGVVKDFEGVVNLTQQEFKGECDINRIMKRATSTGVIPGIPGARYGDFSGIGDFQAAQERLKAAEEDFASLPSAVRERFRNDVGALLAFVADKKNLEEARKLGLVPPAPAEPAPVKVVVEPAPVVKPA